MPDSRRRSEAHAASEIDRTVAHGLQLLGLRPDEPKGRLPILPQPTPQIASEREPERLFQVVLGSDTK
jgi:hypothetical protein